MAIDGHDLFGVHSEPEPSFDYATQLGLANALLAARSRPERLTFDFIDDENAIILAAPVDALERLHRSRLLQHPGFGPIDPRC